MDMYQDYDLDKTTYLVIQYLDDTDKYRIVLRTTNPNVAKDKVKCLWEQGKKAQLKREVLHSVDVTFIGDEDDE